MAEKKAQLSILLSQDLVDWIDSKIDSDRIFANRSHAIEYCVMNAKKFGLKT